jgi:uncharacterized protein YndB with AHSA1/START domain
MTRPVSNLQSGDAVIVLHRVFDAPRELVFEMFTKPEHLAQFWGPKAMRNTACTVDLRVGGAFRVEVQGPDGTVYPATGAYREIVPPERIVYAATTADENPCGAGLPPRSIVTISFADLGGKTRLTVHAQLQSHADVEAAIAGGFNAGWTDSFDRLADLLARQPSN